MKFALFSLLVGLLAALGMAQQEPFKSVVISYPLGTADKVLKDTIKAVLDLGGEILHIYTIIPGFAANVPDIGLDVVKELGKLFHVVIEEDQLVHTNEGPGIKE